MVCSLLTLDVQIIGLQEVAAAASDRLVVHVTPLVLP
jgi:hypothetical protein